MVLADDFSENAAMNSNQSATAQKPSPDFNGNPANPSLEERKKIIEKNKRRSEPVENNLAQPSRGSGRGFLRGEQCR
jgi:hypothetical protein